MKQPYSLYSPPLKKFVKTFGFDSYESALDFFDNKKAEIRANSSVLDLAEISLSKASFCMDYQIIKGNCIHYFLPGFEFCKWLVGCVKSADPEHVEILQSQIGHGHCAVFHFPTSTNFPSFSFHLWSSKLCDDSGCKNHPRGMITLSVDKYPGLEKGYYLTFDFDGRELPPVQSGGPGSGHEWFSRLVVGVCMYTSVFPETLIEGIPDDLKHPAHHQNKNNKTIGVSPKVWNCGSERSAVTPHFRRGHFRTLKSEKFTNKRFQVVFVHETFVKKAKAMTVLTPEEVTT